MLGLTNHPATLWAFAVAFGFSMGADYMLIPLVTAECFGTQSLGKILGLIIMGYSLGQWGAPWFVGRIFDASHSYQLGWRIMGAAAIVGAGAVYLINRRRGNPDLKLKVNPPIAHPERLKLGVASLWLRSVTLRCRVCRPLRVSTRFWDPRIISCRIGRRARP
jgi:MFS family permease